MKRTEKIRPFSDSVSSRVSHAIRKAASKKLSAFTLVELIVVVTILAILATIGFLALSGYSQDAKDASVKANVRSIYSAIAAESALTGNSPRFYVVHDTGAALSDGTVAFVDGSPVTLSGGAYGTAGTNYSAGNPDWAKLKLNPEKFRLSSLPSKLASVFGTAQAAYDPALASVWAVDAALAPTANGRSRSASFFQVAGTAPATKVVSVAGNFPSPTPAQTASGATVGLVKASTWTGAMMDGSSSAGGSSSSSSSSSSGGPAAYAPGTVYTAGQSFTWTSPVGSVMTISVTGKGIGTVNGQFAQTGNGGTPCDSPDIAVWYGPDVQVWSACNMGTAVSGTGSSSYGFYYQWGNNHGFSSATNISYSAIDCTAYTASSYSGTFIAVSDICASGKTNPDLWWEVTNTPVARKGPCPTGYHVPSSKWSSWEFITLKTIMDGYQASGIGTCGWTGNSSPTISTKNAVCALKIPAAGYINPGILPWPSSVGNLALLSSGTQFNTYDRGQIYYDVSADVGWIGTNNLSWTATAYAIRCIKN